MKINTQLVAHAEHISEDLASEFPDLDDATINKLVEFVETYIKSAVEIALENPKWFK
jgi:hypothetical protein